MREKERERELTVNIHYIGISRINVTFLLLLLSHSYTCNLKPSVSFHYSVYNGVNPMERHTTFFR